MCSVFDKSENEGKSGPAPESNGGGSLDDDIPFAPYMKGMAV
jgi:hypothetical protein